MNSSGSFSLLIDENSTNKEKSKVGKLLLFWIAVDLDIWFKLSAWLKLNSPFSVFKISKNEGILIFDKSNSPFLNVDE